MAMNNRLGRQSNFELLRIFAAMAVIVLHYNNASMGNALGLVNKGSINYILLSVAECISICSVNVFVILTGYFKHCSLRCDLLKPVRLLMQLFIIELTFCLMFELPNEKGITLREINQYFTSLYWFVFVYIALYLLSPWISSTYRRQSPVNKKKLLILYWITFSLCPFGLSCISTISGLDWNILSPAGLNINSVGATIIHFILLYLVGAWLQEHQNYQLPVWLLFMAIALIVCILTLFTAGGNTVQLRYENPLVVAMAILIFLLFKGLKTRNNRIINALGAGAFPCYLIHVNILGLCRIEIYVNQEPWKLLLHLGFVVIVIYLISYGINILYYAITEPVFRLIDTRWKNCRWYEAN